ncbi:hypothetical protein SUGI_1081780 [Cryptomeria japonica]|nr:hypothetical protein SUGI_1081780 [Cryptomeria japonica]
MISLTRLLLVMHSADEHAMKENIRSAVQKSCMNYLYKTLVDSNLQVEMAELHGLRTILQRDVAEKSPDKHSQCESQQGVLNLLLQTKIISASVETEENSQGTEFSADEHFVDASFVLPITDLCMHCMHKSFRSAESVFPRYSVVIGSSLRKAERLACQLSSEIF